MSPPWSPSINSQCKKLAPFVKVVGLIALDRGQYRQALSCTSALRWAHGNRDAFDCVPFAQTVSFVHIGSIDIPLILHFRPEL